MAATTFVPPEIVRGTTTSWLPVSTAYPSISGCADAFFLYPGQPAPVGWDPGYGYFAGGPLRCLPPEQTKWHEQDHENPEEFTSLSIQPIVCPQAFTTAATEVRSESSTYVMCCPSGYGLVGGQPGRVAGSCWSPLSAGQRITYTAPGSSNDWIDSTWTVVNATSISAVAMKGWNVRAAAVSTTATSTTAVTSVAVPPTGLSTVDVSSTGLSTGAEAGIGVGVGLIAVITICSGFLWFHKRQRNQRSIALPENSSAEIGPAPVTLEADVTPVHEMRDTLAPKYTAHDNLVELESHLPQKREHSRE